MTQHRNPAVRRLAMSLAPLLLFMHTGAAAAERVLSWQEPRIVATGGGYQGPWRMNRSVFDYVDAPTVVVDEAGAMAVSWVDQARKRVLFQRYSAAGEAEFPSPVDVSRSPEVFSWLPRLALPPADPETVYMLWQEIIFSGGSHGGDILFAHSSDGGRSFSAPQNLSADPAGAGKGRVTEDFWHNGSLDLTVGPEGNIYVAWSDYEGDLWFTRSEDRGQRFTEPLRLAANGAAGPALGPSLAVDPHGVVHLAWTVGETPHADVYISKSKNQGESFTTPGAVFSSPGHADAPRIAADGAGVIHLVYGDSPAGPFARYHVLYARRASGEQAFSNPVNVSGRQLEHFGSTGFPSLAVAGDNEVYIGWELFPEPASRPNGIGFAYSSDGGRSFSEAAVVPGSIDAAGGVNGSMQGLLTAKLDAAPGRIALVNSTFRDNDSSEVQLFRGALTAATGR